MPDSPQQDPRVYFAAERTFLAWIRTGLGLMGVGFAVSRFGLFLAVINHLVVVKKLATGTWQPGQPSKTAVALAILLALLGTGMAIYLIRFR
jgi:putative membrane protein